MLSSKGKVIRRTTRAIDSWLTINNTRKVGQLVGGVVRFREADLLQPLSRHEVISQIESRISV